MLDPHNVGIFRSVNFHLSNRFCHSFAAQIHHMFPASASLATCLLSLFALQGAHIANQMKLAVALKNHEGSFATRLTVLAYWRQVRLQ